MISFLDMLLRMGVALLLGALIGFERERREHEAGMRTIALVCLGSCLFTLVSAYGFLSLLGIPHISLDPTRVVQPLSKVDNSIYSDLRLTGAQVSL